jgi:hypothetical protein
MSRYSILFAVFFLCSCNEDKKYDFKLEATEIKIPIAFEQLAFYPVATVLHTDSAELFLGYNYAYNSIDLFDLGKSIFLQSIKIPSDGPQSATNLSQLYAGKNFIVASSPPLVYKISYNGTIQKKYKYDLFQGELNGYTLDPDIQIANFKQLYYNESDDYILKNMFNTAKKLEDEYYSTSLLFCKVYLDQAKIEPVLVGYPAEFGSGAFFGDLDSPYGFYENDSLIYNFPSISKLFIYTNTHTLQKEINPTSTPAQSSLIEKEKYGDIQERLRHYLTSPQFFGVVKHKQLGFYLRIHKDYTEKVGLDNSKNYLMFISKGLGKSYEVPISEKFNPIPFPVSGGILFQQKPTKSENFLTLKRFNLNKDLLDYLTIDN